MRIDRVEPSRHKADRVLVFLEDGTLLRVTEQELLDFPLHPGAELDEETLERLRDAAGGSDAKKQAAALIGRRAMSRRDLTGKLRKKGASEQDARYAAEWLEAIGALNDADYAAALVRRCADMGYGPARCREELYKHGIPRELWEEALAAAPEAPEVIGRWLESRFHGRVPDGEECRRAAAALARRGFSWSDVRSALSRYAEDLPEE